jgi:hypothetical protein
MASDTPESSIIPVTFVPIEKVLVPQVEVIALSDISGWVTDDGKIGPKYLAKKGNRIHLRAGEKYTVDEPTARAWIAKGYVTPTEDLKKPLSEDEIAELRSDLTVVGLEPQPAQPLEGAEGDANG